MKVSRKLHIGNFDSIHRLILLVCLVFIGGSLTAQIKNYKDLFSSKQQSFFKDTEFKASTLADTDTLKLKYYSAMAKKSFYESKELSKYYNLECLKLAAVQKDSVSLVQRTIALAYIEMAWNNFEQARSHLEASEEIALQSRNKKSLAHNYTALGWLERRMNKHDLAIKHYFKAKALAEETGDDQRVMDVLNRLSIEFRVLKDYEKSSEYLEQIIEYNETNEKHYYYKAALKNIVKDYLEVGDTTSAESVLEKTAKLNEKQETSYQKINYLHAHMNLSMIRKEWRSAVDYGKDILQLVSKNKDRAKLFVYNSTIAQAYSKLGNDELSLKHLKEAYTLSQSLGNLSQRVMITRNLSKYYEKRGDIFKSHFYLKESDQLREEQGFDQIQINLKQLEIEMRKKKSEEEIQLLETKNKLKEENLKQNKKQKNLFVLLSFLMTAFAGFLLYAFQSRLRVNRKLEENQIVITKALDEKEFLLKEIHHRVKNNLQVVAGLLKWQSSFLEDKNALNAFNDGRNRVESMAIIHQKLYQTDNLTGIEMHDYIQRLSQSLFHAYNIKPDQIKFESQIAELNLDVDTVIPLGLIINELMSNALKHAFPEDRTGMISISLDKDLQNDCLKLLIKDDGVGMDEEVDELAKESFGWELIKTLAKKLKAEISITNDLGTSVQLDIKNYKLV